MLPGIIQNELGPTGPPAPFKQLSAERTTSLADLLRSESAEDLRYWRPSVVIVERCSLNHFCLGMAGKDFNMLAWFLQSPSSRQHGHTIKSRRNSIITMYTGLFRRTSFKQVHELQSFLNIHRFLGFHSIGCSQGKALYGFFVYKDPKD